MDGKRLSSILVKPAGPDCSLNCRYCFYLGKQKLYPDTPKHRMSNEVLEELMRQAMIQSGPAVSFGWQGGEPTLMGLPFFEKVVSYQERYGSGQIVDNGLQTNGILLGRKWAEFLSRYKFLVGLSLDGPEHVHDRYRRKRGGDGTWNVVHEKADMLLGEGVAMNALCCVTDYSVQFPEELYEYFKSIGIHWMQFIPVLEPDKDDPRRAASFSVDAERFGDFLCRLWDLWLGDFEDGAPTTSIRWFESLFYTYVGMTAPECTLHRECGDYVVVEHHGDV